MSQELGLGKLITTPQKRDAIHVAVAPVVAGERLLPGQRIGLVADGTALTTGVAHIGIVDPFLTRFVMTGKQFWMFLFPGTITSLRHDWAHPAFTQQANKEDEEPEDYLDWLHWFCRQLGLPYDVVMKAVKQYLINGEQLAQSDGDNQRQMMEKHKDKFWRHYAKSTCVVGKGNFFSTPWEDNYFGCSGCD